MDNRNGSGPPGITDLSGRISAPDASSPPGVTDLRGRRQTADGAARGPGVKDLGPRRTVAERATASWKALTDAYSNRTGPSAGDRAGLALKKAANAARATAWQATPDTLTFRFRPLHAVSIFKFRMNQALLKLNHMNGGANNNWGFKGIEQGFRDKQLRKSFADANNPNKNPSWLAKKAPIMGVQIKTKGDNAGISVFAGPYAASLRTGKKATAATTNPTSTPAIP